MGITHRPGRGLEVTHNNLIKAPIKTLFANISLVVILNLLVKPVWILVEMQVQDVIGHDIWGLYAALLSLGFLFITLSDLGINQYSTQHLASRPELLPDMVPYLLSSKFVLIFFYPIILMGVGWVLGYRGVELYFLALICLIHGSNQLLEFFRANFRALQRFQIDGFMSVFERLLLLGLVWILFLTQLDIERFIYARLLALGVGVVVFYLALVRIYGWIRPRLSLPKVKEVIRYSWAFALMTILYSVHDKVDQVMLERMAGDVQNGLYVAAYRWVDGFGMYLWTVLPIFFARFAFYIKDHKEQEKLLHFGQPITAIPMIFVCLFVFFYGDKLLFLFDQSSPEQLAIMFTCLRILFIAILFHGFMAIFSTLLTSTGHLRFVNRLVFASILLNVVLNAIFIPQYGAIACAWSTVASYTLMDFGYLVYIAWKLPVKLPWREMLRLSVVLVMGAGLFFGGMWLGISWYLTSLMAGLGILGGAFALDLISARKIREFRV